MKITRRQLRKIIREATGIQGRDFFRYETDAAYAAAVDADGNGVPDNQEDTMDPDAKVTMILNKINDLLQDAHEIARNAPDHQNKGEGHAMAEIVHSVDEWFSSYGSGEWQ